MTELLMTRDPLTERQLRRTEWRVGRFQRYGMSLDEARRTADRLTTRDQERDDRRICLECSNYAQDLSCLAARRGLIKGATKNLQPIPALLLRCERFDFATPA